ncbi:MAG: OsmC family protein [Saprospiraceae bacterium]
MKTHHYQTNLQWTGNEGRGTLNYRAYSRNHVLSGLNKIMEIPGSSDPSFRGDPGRYNPEELLVASLSACHMLWFLHLCAVNKIVVSDYQDQAAGIMEETADGGGRFREVTLYPVVTVASEEMADRTEPLHEEAHRLCFIANSCNFPVKHQPEVRY